MSEIMNHHVEENNNLREKNNRLTETFKKTKQDFEINELAVRTKISESHKAKDEIINLKNQNKNLTNELNLKKEEYNNETQLVLSTVKTYYVNYI